MLDFTPAELALIESADNAVILGIITGQRRVHLRLADPQAFPGHAEWLAKDRIVDVIRGFSLLIRNGRILAIYPRSRLNPGQDARLDDEFLQDLMSALPTDTNVQVLE